MISGVHFNFSSLIFPSAWVWNTLYGRVVGSWQLQSSRRNTVSLLNNFKCLMPSHGWSKRQPSNKLSDIGNA